MTVEKTPVLLTDEGRYYLEQMKRVRAMTRSVRQDLLDIADPAKTLRVGIGQVRGNHWLPIVLPFFCDLHPDINVHVIQGTESRMENLLQTDKMDLAFGALPPSLRQMKTVELFRGPEPLLLTAHKRFGLIPPEQRGPYDIHYPYVIQPEKLDGLPFIAPDVSNGMYDAYHSVLTGNGIHPGRVITVTNLVTGMNLTLRALGVQLIYAAIPQYAFISDVSPLDFCVLEKMPPNRPCIAAYRDSSIKMPMIQDFIDIVRREVVPMVSF